MKKKGGSVKNTDDVLVTAADLTADVTGVLPMASGGTGLSAAGTSGNVLTSTGTGWASSAPGTTAGLATGAWGAPGTEAANKIDTTLQMKDAAGTNLAVATCEVEVCVSDSATDAEPSATATLGAASTPLGTLLSGAGSATATYRCSAAGQIAVGVTDASVASRFLWIRQGKNSQFWVRATAAPLQITFA